LVYRTSQLRILGFPVAFGGACRQQYTMGRTHRHSSAWKITCHSRRPSGGRGGARSMSGRAAAGQYARRSTGRYSKAAGRFVGERPPVRYQSFIRKDVGPTASPLNLVNVGRRQQKRLSPSFRGASEAGGGGGGRRGCWGGWVGGCEREHGNLRNSGPFGPSRNDARRQFPRPAATGSGPRPRRPPDHGERASSGKGLAVNRAVLDYSP